MKRFTSLKLCGKMIELSDNHKEYKRFKEKAANLKKLKGPISKEMAFDMLIDRFLVGISVDDIVAKYGQPGAKPSFIRRIVSPLSGVDTSRLQDVRNLFSHFCKAIGVESPFKEYHCPPEARKNKRSGGLGVLKG